MIKLSSVKSKTSEKILDLIRKRGQIAPKELVDELLLSNRAIFKQVKNLREKGLIKKIGVPPKVYYSISEPQVVFDSADIDEEIRKILDENFYNITPLGLEQIGLSGFERWCKTQKLPTEKTAREYVATLKKYEIYKKDGLIDGMKKMHGTFENVYLDDIFYLDFYAIERFGKTKLGQQLLVAKQSQNLKQIKELIEAIRPKLKRLIKKFRIDCIGFIPPTVKRERQIMYEFQKALHFNLPVLKILKTKTPIIVAQKTLSRLNDRIENARSTLVVADDRKYSNILLIDDAVGSGASLNETARKIKEKKLARGSVVGLAVVGSFKGFDVISEV
jgi:biotin operon repressor